METRRRKPHLVLNNRDILIPILVIHVQVRWLPVTMVTRPHPLQHLAVDEVIENINQSKRQLLTWLEGVWSVNEWVESVNEWVEWVTHGSEDELSSQQLSQEAGSLHHLVTDGQSKRRPNRKINGPSPD